MPKRNRVRRASTGHFIPPTTTTTVAPTSTTAPATTAAPTTTGAPTTVAVSTVRVTRVIDGDTVDVSDGSRIRLIGIDTPERGECGYAQATKYLEGLVGVKAVVLVAGARDDVDRYGRLLRYVEVDGVDANFEMIIAGLAIARYDSRNGYGRHDREDQYVYADNATPSSLICDTPTTAAPAPPPPPPPPPPSGGGTDPRFGTCKEAKANGYGPYYQGVDPEYGWYRDADKDGVVCE
jgi:endonuclease YncB( thermonuclease family)